jgi:hypothetical protein
MVEAAMISGRRILVLIHATLDLVAQTTSNNVDDYQATRHFSGIAYEYAL